MSTHDDLRAIALAEFAANGYAGTSLQRIAEVAGVSKASVLYHFSSKEALLEASVGPAIDRLTTIIDAVDGTLDDREARHAFVEQFVDLLLEHRLEVFLFINQGAGLEDVPVVDRANLVVERLAQFFCTAASTTEDQLRFGMALGGAAYVLSVKTQPSPRELPVDEVRAALVRIVNELLDPIVVVAGTR
ncbi:TetR/AcrR family transcriptional regulator [Galbitalea soli]|uniref:TetR/AcrR family transcriptional regulator n=1 Tax=Galbitalea soli TaxID=1268042 RepID=A0A7C9PL10_9MICO|nr:TetR/AcrR family transcriptional regulator [Galbitalea soli]NEM89747.1 TetR/AcrR family transcriptional regulator [Galbitalea soli]NYJ30448.1 AcrR family transcriptional regulator [Galbitalea soli]